MIRKNNKQSILHEILVIDESFTRSKKRGNGTIRKQVWQDKDGKVTRYSLTFINGSLYRNDNGRVLGYDNAHGYHHKHYFGKVERFDFINYESLEKLFLQECEALYDQL